MSNPVIQAVSVALRCRTRLLLVRRGREPWKGLYAFPGGRMEQGEEAEAAARRELCEETGLIAGNLHILKILDLETPQAAYRLHVFGAEHSGSEPVAGDDAEAVGWFSLDEMENLPLTDSTRAIAMDILGVVEPKAPRCG